MREAINRLTGLGLVRTHDRSGTRVETGSDPSQRESS
ncbi:hypothetical protein SH661x_002497 [Planctomicrobium sp. SH661]